MTDSQGGWELVIAAIKRSVDFDEFLQLMAELDIALVDMPLEELALSNDIAGIDPRRNISLDEQLRRIYDALKAKDVLFKPTEDNEPQDRA